MEKKDGMRQNGPEKVVLVNFKYTKTKMSMHKWTRAIDTPSPLKIEKNGKERNTMILSSLLM